MPSKKTKQINLMPNEGLESTTFGRILKWALSTFRFMVIVTELIVMAAFLSRFWLDARNSDLNEAVKVNSAQVKAYSDVEKQFRELQKKLTIIKSIYTQNKSSDTITTMTQTIPADITLSTISIIGSTFQMKAVSSSEMSIAQLIANLEANKSFDKIVVSQISSSSDNPALTLFTVSGELKGGNTPAVAK